MRKGSHVSVFLFLVVPPAFSAHPDVSRAVQVNQLWDGHPEVPGWALGAWPLGKQATRQRRPQLRFFFFKGERNFVFKNLKIDGLGIKKKKKKLKKGH